MSKKDKKKKKDKVVDKSVDNYVDNNKKVLERYKLYCRNKGLTKKSIESICNSDLRLFLKYIGNRDILTLTYQDIEDYFIYCQDVRGNCAETVARKFSSLNTLYKTLITQEIIVKNPLDKLVKPKKRKKVSAYLTEDEYKQVMEYIDSQGDIRGAALFSLFYSSACRISEIHQLNRDSLDFSTRTFKVLGKGEKERVCMFSEDAKQRLLKYLGTRTDNYEALFYSRQKLRWHQRTIQNYVKGIVKAAGITKDISPHKLRHTRAMVLVENDVPLEVIQKLLGHDNISTTQIYARMRFDSVKQKIDEFDSALQ